MTSAQDTSTQSARGRTTRGGVTHRSFLSPSPHSHLELARLIIGGVAHVDRSEISEPVGFGSDASSSSPHLVLDPGAYRPHGPTVFSVGDNTYYVVHLLSVPVPVQLRSHSDEPGLDVAWSSPRQSLDTSPWPLSPTTWVFDDQRQLVQGRAEEMFLRAQDEVFDDGVESRLVREMGFLVRTYGVDAVRALGEVLTSALVNDEAACEALRHLGTIGDSRSQRERFRLLTQHLHSESPRRRYAAAVGLADANAPEVLTVLEEAIAVEPLDELRQRFRRFSEWLRP